MWLSAFSWPKSYKRKNVNLSFLLWWLLLNVRGESVLKSRNEVYLFQKELFLCSFIMMSFIVDVKIKIVTWNARLCYFFVDELSSFNLLKIYSLLRCCFHKYFNELLGKWNLCYSLTVFCIMLNKSANLHKKIFILFFKMFLFLFYCFCEKNNAENAWLLQIDFCSLPYLLLLFQRS